MKRLHYAKKILTHEEWLKEKEKTIGGSEAAAVINHSKWLTADDLFNKLVHGKVKNVKTNEKMIKGTNAEEHIRALFALDFDYLFKVINPPVRKHWFFYRKDKPYLSYTPDGLLVNKLTGKKWLVEIKYVEIRTNADKNVWESNDIPDQYYWQNMQGLVVLDNVEGIVLFAHLKYFTHDEETDKWVFDYAKDIPFFMYREEVQDHVDYLEKSETDFYEINIKGRKRPKLVIHL